VRDFTRLKTWQRAHELTLAVYRATERLPEEERFGLRLQLRRACASIPTNIAEGCGRSTDADFGRFLAFSAGSATETEYLLVLARDLGFIGASASTGLLRSTREVKKMLFALMKRVSSASDEQTGNG